VPEFLLDFLLPKTDKGVGQQWMVMTPIWLLGLWLVRRQVKDIRQFVLGLVIINIAWFCARMVH
jgi:hypothetical protein